MPGAFQELALQAFIICHLLALLLRSEISIQRNAAVNFDAAPVNALPGDPRLNFFQASSPDMAVWAPLFVCADCCNKA